METPSLEERRGLDTGTSHGGGPFADQNGEDGQRPVSRRLRAEPDTGAAVVWNLLLRRARKRGFALWYIGLTSLCTVGMAYLGTQPYSAAVMLILMNCGWGATALTLWQDLKDRNAQVDFLLLPIADREWRRILDGFFALGFAVTVAQFLVFFGFLCWLEWPSANDFLRWTSPEGVRWRRLQFHGLVVLMMVGFFWSGYWGSVWRGWPLVVVALLPFVVLGVGLLSVRRVIDMRLALGGVGTGMLLLGFLFRSWVNTGWRQRAAEVLLK
jgi:hypothetical protein